MAIDYRSFKDLSDPSKQSEEPENSKSVVQWWTSKPGEELANSVFSQVAALIQNDKSRIESYNRNAQRYGGETRPVSSTGFSVTTVNPSNWYGKDRIAFNLVQCCIDTLTSKMAKNKPRPYFLTSKGDSKRVKKAKLLNSYTSGLFYENNAYQRMPIGFRDGCVWGEGIINISPFNGRVKWTRALPYELLADYLECHNGHDEAKTLHWVKTVDRSTLQAMLPKEQKAIDKLENTNSLMSGGARSVSDTVSVVESWRLPSAPGADDGIHCINGPGMTLLYEPEYAQPFFPFGVFRYSDRLHGFWGQGLSEQLAPIQTELNRCLMTIQRSFHLGGSFKILRHVTSKIIKSHLDNQIGTIIDWAGDHPPQYVTPPMVQPEIYQQVERLLTLGFQQSGISQLSASGTKPAGLDSGEAQRVYHDIETDRFQMVGQGYEEFGLDLARISIAVAKGIYEEHDEIKYKVPGKRFIEMIDWKDVELDEDEYVMQCYPVSKLPTDPAGRLEHIQELMQAGLIEPETGRRLLDYPDLEEEESLNNALMDYVHQVLDGIVDDGEYNPPDPTLSIPVQLKLCLEYYAAGLRDNLEPERVEMLRDYMKAIKDVQDGQQMLAQQQAMAQQQASGAPQANPAPPPVSNMIPNVPGAAPTA